MPLFLIALLFLWVTETDRKVRVVLLYLVAAIAVIFLCPLYAWVGTRIDEEVYYRVFWTLPIGILVCYGAVRLMMRFRHAVSRALVFFLTLLVIGFYRSCGSIRRKFTRLTAETFWNRRGRSTMSCMMRWRGTAQCMMWQRWQDAPERSGVPLWFCPVQSR